MSEDNPTQYTRTPAEQAKGDRIEEWVKETTNRIDRQWRFWAEGTHR